MESSTRFQRGENLLFKVTTSNQIIFFFTHLKIKRASIEQSLGTDRLSSSVVEPPLPPVGDQPTLDVTRLLICVYTMLVLHWRIILVPLGPAPHTTIPFIRFHTCTRFLFIPASGSRFLPPSPSSSITSPVIMTTNNEARYNSRRSLDHQRELSRPSWNINILEKSDL